MTKLNETLKERGSRYGSFKTHADIACQLKAKIHSTDGWYRCSNVQRQALDVIADKIARMLNGDPDYIDNWHDIAGYATLVEIDIQEEAAKNDPSNT